MLRKRYEEDEPNYNIVLTKPLLLKGNKSEPFKMRKHIETYLKPPVLATFGNPLLDLEAYIEDQSILEELNLQHISVREVDVEEFEIIFQAATKKCKVVSQNAGGSAQNTARFFQWHIQSPGYTVHFGGVGDDDRAKFLGDIVSKDGVTTRYVYNKNLKTGVCISFINGSRTLVACPAAANHYTLTDLDNPDNWKTLEKVIMIYVEGFFITHSYPVIERLVSFCNVNGTCFSLNISGEYVGEQYGDKLLEVMKSADVIFGHTSEYRSLKKHLPYPVNSHIDVALFIQMQSQLSQNKRKGRKGIPPLFHDSPIIVITNGRDNVDVFLGEQRTPLTFPVPQLDKDDVKDTTGAGDAFVAGFLAAAFSNFDIKMCVQSGCLTALEVIQKIGVVLPDRCPQEMYPTCKC